MSGSGRLVRLWANAKVGLVLVPTATPPTVGPQHLNIPKGHLLHTEDTLQAMQKQNRTHKID